MSALQSVGQHQPNPAIFFDTVQGYQRTFVLQAGVDLDLFTAIAKGSRTAPEIAKSCGATERGARVLCDCLTVMGFLTKAANRYSLTTDSAMFLDSRSPAYLGRALKFMLHPRQLENIEKLAETARNGKKVAESVELNPEDPLWVEFARGMAPLMMPAAQVIAQVLKPTLASQPSPKVLDIAAGHGTFGITVAEHFPNAQIYAMDWANVLEVAKQNAKSRGVLQRYHAMPGSAFEVAWGSGYDAVLLTNFLHHFDPETNTALLKKAYAALNPGGQVVILEFVPNDDRVSPPGPAMFSLVMLASTPQGDAYTLSQHSQTCRSAGFEEPRLIPLQGLPQSLIITTKPA